MSFAKSMLKNIGKNVFGKCSQKFLDHAKQSATDAVKTTPKIEIQKSAEVTGNLIGHKIANKITRSSRIDLSRTEKSVAIKCWSEWDLNPRPLISGQTLKPTKLSGHEFNSYSEPTLYNYFNFIVCSVSDFISASAFVSFHFYM